jgi:hypothetical protein
MSKLTGTSSHGTRYIVLPEEILSNSPSLQDDIPPKVERDHRFWGCELIQEAGILLRLPQVVMATGQTIFQRFFYRKSLKEYDAFRTAMGALFLAAKVEEKSKRMSELVTVFYAILRRRKWKKQTIREKLLDLDTETYSQWREWVILVERQILIDLGFSIYTIMDHPHKFILYYIKILNGSKELAQKAWGYINDSLRIDLCTRFLPEVIACSAIFLSARQLQIKLPTTPKPWWELFEVKEEQMHQICLELLDLYKLEHIEWLDPLTEVDPFAVEQPSIPEASIEMDTSMSSEQQPLAPTQITQLTQDHVKELAHDAFITKESHEVHIRQVEKKGTKRQSIERKNRFRREESRERSRDRLHGRSRSRDRKSSRNKRESRSKSRDRKKSRRDYRSSRSRSRYRSRHRGRSRSK